MSCCCGSRYWMFAVLVSMSAWLGGAMTVSLVGCNGSSGTSTGQAEGDDHDHDHEGHDHDEEGHDDHEGHDHGPAGPHGGHTESFDQPGFAFEWIHEDEEQLVRIVILDEAKKEAVAVAATKVTIKCDKGREPQEFTLNPVSPDADGKASEFSLKDGQLLVALNLGVDVSIEIDGMTYTKTLEPHDHNH